MILYNVDMCRMIRDFVKNASQKIKKFNGTGRSMEKREQNQGKQWIKRLTAAFLTLLLISAGVLSGCSALNIGRSGKRPVGEWCKFWLPPDNLKET